MKKVNGLCRVCMPLVLGLAVLAACSRAAIPSATAAAHPTALPSASSTAAEVPSPAETLVPTYAPSPTAMSTVENLGATVTADLLSCRYGPGPKYLFLYGLRKGANIVLVGRTDGENWHWVYVQGKRPCWVKTDFLNVEGEWLRLPMIYPGSAKLPISPYYPPTTVLHATRQRDQVTVQWLDIPLRAGDEEDANMQHYILEVWRCEGGHLLFEPLATNDTSISFVDEAGCSQPSHGRVFVQEKHGFAGPTEIPWPPQ